MTIHVHPKEPLLDKYEQQSPSPLWNNAITSMLLLCWHRQLILKARHMTVSSLNSFQRR